MTVNSYKDLIIWQKSFKLVLLIYKLTENFPEKERYGLINQLRRAAVSIVSNIAEGFSRKSQKEYTQFLKISYGSSSEVETQLLLAEELQFGKKELYDEIKNILIEIRKMLNSMLISKH